MLWWLKVSYCDKRPRWPAQIDRIQVDIIKSEIIPNNNEILSRTSPIFPLIPEKIFYIYSGVYNINFYTYKNPFRLLGKVKKSKFEDLKSVTWFSSGLCSIILIYNQANESCVLELESLSIEKPVSKEVWTINNRQLSECDYEIQEPTLINYGDFLIRDYSCLNNTAKGILDEFCANINLLIPKVATFFPSELDTFHKLHNQVGFLVDELIYLTTYHGDVPETLNDYTEKELKESQLLKEKIFHQNIDRIVQINSALGYVATQALSGCTPILERRSLIRRHSLLGIGSAILALNRLVRSIENALSQFPIEKIVNEQMLDSPAIEGIKLPYYDDFEEWEINSINQWSKEIKPREGYPKLPYFSGRLGFRETEYSISASLHCINQGITPDWSMLTVTHEMLHGHVRNFLTMLFSNGKISNRNKFDAYYENYQRIIRRETKGLNYADTIRSLILFYCSFTIDFGSLTKVPVSTPETRNILNHSKDKVEEAFISEFRNINEVFVHILDLHYIYAGRLSAYIPLIWSSWSSVPHVRANLRHYILRTLIIIASKKEFKGIERFKQSLGIMNEIFENQLNRNFIDTSLVQEVLRLLNNLDFKNTLILPFKSSLVLVDLVSNLFTSSKIRETLLKDQFTVIHWDEENAFENSFEYRLSSGFHDEKIESPSSYLLGRMINQLNTHTISDNIVEYETVAAFLAMISDN